MEEQKLEIYWGRKELYSKELSKLNKWKISNRSKELLMQFHNHLFASGCGEVRVSKLSAQLRKIALHLKKDLDIVDKHDIESLIAKYNREKSWSDATKADYRRAVKQFYLWFEDYDERLQIPDDVIDAELIRKYKRLQIETQKFYKYILKSIKTKYPIKKPKWSEIIKDDELQVVLDKGARSSKERAFMKILHESGFRIGEHLNVRIGDMKLYDDRVIFSVDGKTGQRDVPLVQSIGLLTRWLEEHPFRDNPRAYLWLSHNPRNKFEPLKYNGAVKLIKRCFERTDMKHKKHNCHWFRKSRATILGRYLTENMMCLYFGWETGSSQPKIYCGSHSSQVEDAVLTMHGMKKEEDSAPRPKKCSSCLMVNETEARYCHRCGKALSIAIFLHDEEKKKNAVDEAFELLQKITGDPKLLKKFEEFKRTANT